MSVHLSIAFCTAAAACGDFVSVGPAGRRCRSMAAQRAPNMCGATVWAAAGRSDTDCWTLLVLFYNRCDFCILVPTWSSRQWRTWCWFRDTTPSRCCWQPEIKGFLLRSLIFLQTTCYSLFFSCKFCLFYVEIYAITCYVDIAYIDVT